MGAGGVPKALLHEVKLVFGRDEFVTLLSPTYAEFAEELKQDVELVGDPDDDEQACLRHPTLTELLHSAPSALPGLMRDALWGDLGQLCFGENPTDRCTYVVDAFVSLAQDTSRVTILATAFRIRPFKAPKT